MKHARWWCNLIWRYGCPVCKVRQLSRASKLDAAYQSEIIDIRYDRLFSPAQRYWILRQLGEL